MSTKNKFNIRDFLTASGFIDGKRKNVEITICMDHVVIDSYKSGHLGNLFYHRVDTKIPRNKSEAKALLRLVVSELIEESEFSFHELHMKAIADNEKMAALGGKWKSVKGTAGYWENEKGEWIFIHSIADAVMIADLQDLKICIKPKLKIEKVLSD